MTKKILMICNHFAPDNTIAAVRMTKFAKCLKENGYDITVLAEKKENIVEDDILKRDAQGINVIRIDNTRIIKIFIYIYKTIISPIKERGFNNLDNRMRINEKTGKFEFYTYEAIHPFIGSMDYVVELLRQYDLFKGARKYIRDYQNVNLIFTSYGDYFSLFSGYYFSKKNKAVPWVLDIRDNICRYKFTPKYMCWLAKLFEHKSWKTAKCIIGVSKGICRHIPKQHWKKVHCITNGYDKRDREGLTPVKLTGDKLRFVYTGSMYGGLQNLSPIFKSIKRAIYEKKVDKKKIEVCFAGKKSAYEVFLSQAEKYNLDMNCRYYGQLTRKEAMKLQMEGDILMVSSFDYQTGIGGVITGKALEYMSADKPIMAVVNGDIKDSELGEIIKNANLGVVYEEARGAEDEESLYRFLLEKYREYEETGKVQVTSKKEVLRKYDYYYLGKRFLKVIEKI